MELSREEIAVVFGLCNSSPVTGLQGMSEVLRLAGRCQDALRPAPIPPKQVPDEKAKP